MSGVIWIGMYLLVAHLESSIPTWDTFLGIDRNFTLEIHFYDRVTMLHRD